VIVTVLLPASLLVVRTTKILKEATSPGLAKPAKVVVPELPGGWLPITLAVAFRNRPFP